MDKQVNTGLGLNCDIDNLVAQGHEAAKLIEEFDLKQNGFAAEIAQAAAFEISPLNRLAKSALQGAREFSAKFMGTSSKYTSDAMGLGRIENGSLVFLAKTKQGKWLGLADDLTKMHNEAIKQKLIPETVSETDFFKAVRGDLIGIAKSNNPAVQAASAEARKVLNKARQDASLIGREYPENFVPVTLSEKFYTNVGQKYFQDMGKINVWNEFVTKANKRNAFELGEEIDDDLRILQKLDPELDVNKLIEDGFVDDDLAQALTDFGNKFETEVAYVETFGTNDRLKIVKEYTAKVDESYTKKKDALDAELKAGKLTAEKYAERNQTLTMVKASNIKDINDMVRIYDGEYGRVTNHNSVVHSGLSVLKNLANIGVHSTAVITQIPDMVTTMAAKKAALNDAYIQGFKSVLKTGDDELKRMAIAVNKITLDFRKNFDDFNVGVSKNAIRKASDKLERLSGWTAQKLGSASQDDLTNKWAFDAILQQSWNSVRKIKAGIATPEDFELLSKNGISRNEVDEFVQYVDKFGSKTMDSGVEVINPNLHLWGKYGEGITARFKAAATEFKPQPQSITSPTFTQGQYMKLWTMLTSWNYAAFAQKISARLTNNRADVVALYMSGEIAAASLALAIKLQLSGNGKLIQDKPEKFLMVAIAQSGVLGIGANFMDVVGAMTGRGASMKLVSGVFPMMNQLEKGFAGARYLSGNGTVKDLDNMMSLIPLNNALSLGAIARKYLAEDIDSKLYNRNSDLYINESKPEKGN